MKQTNRLRKNRTQGTKHDLCFYLSLRNDWRGASGHFAHLASTLARWRRHYSSELSGQSEFPFGRRQTVQRAGGLPRRSSPGPAGPLTCRRRKIGAHDALPSRRRFCVFWESAVQPSTNEKTGQAVVKLSAIWHGFFGAIWHHQPMAEVNFTPNMGYVRAAWPRRRNPATPEKDGERRLSLRLHHHEARAAYRARNCRTSIQIALYRRHRPLRRSSGCPPNRAPYVLPSPTDSSTGVRSRP